MYKQRQAVLMGTVLWLTAWWCCINPVSASRFEPLDGRVLVFAGQSVASTRNYYALVSVPKPAGFTDYISYDVGASYKPFAPDYPQTYAGNDGLLEPTNWGAGIQCVDCLLQHSEFAEAAIAIGMYLAGPEIAGKPCSGSDRCNIRRLVKGDYDRQLADLARWLNSLGQRPVFLRIGYEFDGDWNGYPPDDYKAAFKYIRNFLQAAEVDNVAYVWQSFGYASAATLRAYYPQPDANNRRYVDWVGYSHFAIDGDAPGVHELAFARRHNLKVFIAEVTPHTGDCARQIDIAKDPALAKTWIDNFIAHVHANRDVVKAFSYINENWSDRDYAPQWSAQGDQGCAGYFAHSNARLGDSPTVAKYWGEKLDAAVFLGAEPGLYRKLRGDDQDTSSVR